MPRLIVNADDFGLTAGVNRAILELHQAGLVTSTTLMARASAAEQAVEIARSAPTLGVGCHIVLVDGDPVLPLAQIPSLIDAATGQLLPTLAPFLARLFTGRVPSAHIEAETAAQIRHLQSCGLRLTHIDTHKHLHLFPNVLRPVLRAARACGINSVRNPFEPIWAVEATARAGLTRTAMVTTLRSLQSTWRRILLEEGFTTTDGTLAFAGTCMLNTATLRTLLEQASTRDPGGAWELVTHPGYNDADLARIRTRLRASRDTERESLPVLNEFPTLLRISFAALSR